MKELRVRELFPKTEFQAKIVIIVLVTVVVVAISVLIFLGVNLHSEHE